MLYITYAIVLLINSFFAFGEKHSKIIVSFTLLFIWLLFWGNTSNPDLDSYIRDYVYLQNDFSVDLYVTEPGFIILMKMGTLLGLDYTAFLAITTAICYALIHNTVKKYTKNANYVYLMYLLHPVFLDIVQFRNFIIFSILVFSIPFLVENTKKSKLKYLLFVVVAATIQNTAILYAPLVLIKRDSKNKLIKYIAYFVVISSILIFLNGNEIPYIGMIISSINDERAERYLSGVGNLGFLIAWSLHTIYFVLLYWSRKIINRNKADSIKENNKIISFVDIVFWINVFAFAYFPLYMIDMAFYRVIRNLILINVIVFSNASDSLANGTLKKLLFNFAVLLGALAWFSYDILGILTWFSYNVLGTHFLEVFEAILENNIFFGG